MPDDGVIRLRSRSGTRAAARQPFRRLRDEAHETLPVLEFPGAAALGALNVGVGLLTMLGVLAGSALELSPSDAGERHAQLIWLAVGALHLLGGYWLLRQLLVGGLVAVACQLYWLFTTSLEAANVVALVATVAVLPTLRPWSIWQITFRR